jgi:hypothetical protein
VGAAGLLALGASCLPGDGGTLVDQLTLILGQQGEDVGHHPRGTAARPSRSAHGAARHPAILVSAAVLVTILFSVSGAIPVPHGPVPACASRRGAPLG